MSRKFIYNAVDKHGKKVRGTIEAGSRDEAIRALKKQGLFATSVNETFDASVKPANEGLQSILDFFGFTLVSHKAMAVFTRKFAGLIKAGIIYPELFHILSEETENRRLRRISEAVSIDLSKGANVSDSLAKYPNVFTKVYRSMISTGEATGSLDVIMDRLADMYDREHEMRSQILSKLYFPIFYLIACFLLISVVVFVVPRFFVTAYDIFPVSTFSAVFSLWLIVAILVLLARTKPGYRIFRSLIAFIPPFGGILRKMSLARFSRMMSALFSSGVPILESLEIAGETLMEPDLIRGLDFVKNEVNAGNDLASALRRSNVFPVSLRSMVRTGEMSGNIEVMFDKAAEYYELEINTKSSMLTAFFYIVILLLVFATFAIFIFSAYSNYWGFVNSFMEG